MSADRDDPPVFPYPAPTPELREEYAEVFALGEPLPLRPLKVVFDRVGALVAILLATPVYLAVAGAILVDGLVHPEHRGPLLSSYISKTCRGAFWKRKFRIVKPAVIDQEAAAAGRWGAFGNEWDPTNLTCVGRVLKAAYLDELPQLFAILAGHISFVGPRPVAEVHYDMLVAQGNMPRRVLQGGLFSPMSVSKGKAAFRDPRSDLGYVRKYMTLSAPALLLEDLRIIAEGLHMVKRAEGH